MSSLTLKELRIKAGLTRNDIYEEFGIPVRTIQNWENETRECPAYVENMLKQELRQLIFVAKIKRENSFGEEKEKGFSCHIKDSGDGEFVFSWFIPSRDGMISTDIVYAIGRLVENGWKVIFEDE